jgi:hypothetical protein
VETNQRQRLGAWKFCRSFIYLGSAPRPVRNCPETLCGITKLSKHDANGCETQEGQRLAVQAFPILCQPSRAVEPGDGSFDDPPAWKHHKTFVVIRTFDDFNCETWQNVCDPICGTLLLDRQSVSLPAVPMRPLPMMNRRRWRCVGRWRQPQRNSGIGSGRATCAARNLRGSKGKADANSKDCRRESVIHCRNPRTSERRHEMHGCA